MDSLPQLFGTMIAFTYQCFDRVVIHGYLTILSSCSAVYKVDPSRRAGIAEGQKTDLTGGDLVRSNKGWRPARDSGHRKGDERILGSSGFVLEVMKAAQETWERTHVLKIEGIDFAAVHQHVARLFTHTPEEILLPGKYRTRVARSVLCYFLVRELGMTATAVAERLRMGQPAVSIAVARGEAIVKEKGLQVS